MTTLAGEARAVLVTGGKLPRRHRRQVERVLRAVRPPAQSRWWAAPDTAGPKVRVGVAWFALLIASLAWSSTALAVVVASVAAVAALQAGQSLRREGHSDLRAVAAPAVAALPLVAVSSSRLVGAVVLVAVAATAVVALGRSRARPGRPGRLRPAAVVATMGTGIRLWLPIGGAAAAVVLLREVDVVSAVVVVALAATYDAGDFLVGSASSHAAEGPVAGMVGLLVVTAAVAVLQPGPFDAGRAWILGAVLAVACPLGQLTASAVLPRAGAFAPALRRLDTWLVAAPVALFVVP